ncbi:hypothetical protein BJ322DRAFT_1179275 [Thelephora terrestris]|uniref:Uncharacterized protein n=1 Tax=Thelephora terrestris TaxID=56493 RepID=A0A9P6HLM5_9AGAM|nr:hypothetical protein BJ322DRAFT_1179275 [Thelephora terrestris]
MPRASTRNPTRRSSSYSPVQESNYNIDRFSHARRDPTRPYPTLGAVMDRTATADPNEGFSDLGFRDFLQAARRVSRRKLARIETNPYANELLNRGVEFVTESNETFNSVLEASVLHTGNVGSMLMDEVAHVNERIDGRREEIEALENWKEDMQGVIHGQEDSVVRQGADIDLLKGEVTTLKDLVRALVTKTGELEDDKVRLTRRISELTGEVRDLQRRCNEPEVRVEEEEGEEVLHRAGSPIIPNRAESPPARLLVRHENRLVPVDDEVIEIGSDEFYQNIGVVRRDTPRPGFVSTPWGSRRQWPALEYDPYAEFVPDSEPNSDTELPDYDDLLDVDPNEIREQNWVNEELESSCQCMFSAPNPFPSSSPVQQPVVPDARRSIWEYKLIRSLQVNRTTGLLTHFPYYRPFAALNTGVTTPPFLLGADHQFLWNSDLTESVLATVYFSISPAFYFPSPRVHLTTNIHTHSPAIIVLWWEIPTELPYSVIEYLVNFERLSDQDFEPFVQQLNQFCQDYHSPVHPYQIESPLSLDIPPPLVSTPGTPFKTRPDTPHPSTDPLAPHKQFVIIRLSVTSTAVCLEQECLKTLVSFFLLLSNLVCEETSDILGFATGL